MAGIGFVLERIVERHGIRGIARVAVVGVLVVAGPWLITSLTLGVVGVVAAARGLDLTLFFGVVVYVFAGTLVVTSGYHYRFTRVVADLLYQKRYDRMIAWFDRASGVSGAIGVALGVGIALFGRLDLPTSAIVVVMTAVVAVSWIAMLMVSILSDFRAIVAAYAVGGLVAAGIIVPVLLLSSVPSAATRGGLLGFTTGTAVVTVYLSVSIRRTMTARSRLPATGTPVRSVADPGLSIPFSTLPPATLRRIGLVGTLLTAILWVDKIVYWVAFGAPVGGSGLVLLPRYDILVFVSQLLLVPAMVFFAVRVETALFRGVRGTLRAIRGGTYREVELRRRDLSSHLDGLFTAQCGLAVVAVAVAWMLSPEIAGAGGAVVFMRVVLASQLYFLMYASVVTLLYLSDYRGVLAVLTIVAGVATAGAVITAVWGAPADAGRSYMVAAGFGAVLAWRLQRNRLRNMDRYLLTRALL